MYLNDVCNKYITPLFNQMRVQNSHQQSTTEKASEKNKK